MFRTKVLEKMKTHILCSKTPPPRKSYCLGGNGEKYGTAAVDNMIRRMRFACWITVVTDTQAEYVMHMALVQQ